MWKRATLVAAVGTAALASGCAEEREPISWVQPNVLDKSFFVGKDLQDPSDDPEFYTQGTLVDVGYGASQGGLFTSTYAQQTSRVKWVITEDSLVARLTHERIDGSDGKGVGPLKNEGQVVASFRIQSHFDIQKQYNPTTGEELNIIVENTTDRHWNERQFFRVDWSKNENVKAYDFDTLAMLGIYGGVKYTPMAYFVNDPTDPNAPHFDTKSGYFDVTTKVFAEPGIIDLRRFGWGIDSFPSCFLPADFLGGSAPAGNCNPVELSIRHSFRRIEPTDYEPADWDGHRFRAFGAFTAERYGYARRYGMTDDKWHRFIARYNIWERSHYYADPENMTGAIECYTDSSVDPHRDVEPLDGTADECQGVTAATGIAGSQCDTFNQKCTLPYRARVQKPVVWYYTTGSNNEFFEPTQWATHDWDVAFRSAAQVARYTECVATGGTVEDCRTAHPVLDGQQIDNDNAVFVSREVDTCRLAGKPDAECDALAETLVQDNGFSAGVLDLARMDEAVVLCHSPVEANDPEVCGGPRLPAGITAQQCADAATPTGNAIPECLTALNARIGDLRYHQVNVIQAPQTPSPWGIMVDAEDPLTGEKVAASINVWSHVNDFISQSIVDTARYIRGELSTADVTEGTYVGDFASAIEAASAGGMAPKMTKAELDQRIADFAQVDVERLKAIETSELANNVSLQREIRRFDQQLRGEIQADVYAPSTNRAQYDARRQRAMGTDLEAKLTNVYMQQLGGVNSTSQGALTQTAVALASPFRGNSPLMQRELRHMREMALAERNACILSAAEAPAPVATADIADLLEQKFGAFSATDSKSVQLERAERMRKFVARRMHYNVVAHEMGHSVGLRHNFVSSSDAFSYRPQYWQLRTANGTQTEACTDYDETGACVGPRYFDPITQDEKGNFLQMFMQSSVMDYAGEYLQDFIGLGVYDFAATRMFYGHTIAVHADPSYNVGTPRGTGMIEKADNFGGTVGFQYAVGADNDPSSSETIHYSGLQNAFQLIRECETVSDVEKFKPSTWNEELDGQWHPTFDGYIVKVGDNYTRCKQQPVDYVPFGSLRAAVPNVESGFNREGPTVDKQDRTRVPYGFATDRWADLGNLSVYRHDNGADAYELFDFFMTSQEINHIFDNYRRNRTTFSIKGAAFRTLSRFNEKMRDGAKGLGLLANIYRDFALEQGYDYNTLWPFIAKANYSGNIMASALAFDHFTRQLARPEPGPHYLPQRGITPAADGVLRSDLDTISNPGRTRVVIPNGATGLFGNVAAGGKLLENTLAEDRDQGEYSAEFNINAGSYYDKIFTPMLMTESYDNFISDSRRDFVDPRYRAVSMADLFPEGFRRWLANNLTGDDQIKGVRIAANESGRPILESGTQYPARGIGWTQWWPVEGPRVCFTSDNLGTPGEGQDYLACDESPVNTSVVDPQIGWEQQKFLIASTLMYLPENQKQYWLNRMWVWELGTDADPGFQNRIEFHDPEGRIYIAKTFGKENIYGKTVQKGISARVLEYANELLAKAYVTTPVDINEDGTADWYEPVLNSNHEPVIRHDSVIAGIGENGEIIRNREGCNADLLAAAEAGDADALDQMDCTCEENVACVALQQYTAVPYFLREAIGTFGLGAPGMKGIW